MSVWIALLRGINVGGRNKLPMKDFAALLEGLGGQDVRTYIQSGNAVFRHPARDGVALGAQISEAIGAAHGFQPATLLLTHDALAQAAAANPFPQAKAAPKSVHLFFLAGPPPRPDLAALERLQGPSEAFVLEGATFYLHTPDGFGTSKLAARVPALLGVEATGRNWRSVETLLEMARALA